MANILSNTDGGLLRKENCAVVFIDHQPQMTFGVSNIDRQLLVNNVYVVEDACGATSVAAHDAALRRTVQAGAVPMTSVATVLEFQRDWANKEHYDAVLNIFRQHGGAYGDGIDYAYTMVHKAPQNAANPHVVK